MEQKIDERLQKAAEDYIEHTPRYDIEYELEEGNDPSEIDCFTIDETIDAFKAGARWQHNSVWHDASEEPKEDVEILVVFNGKWAYVLFYHKHDKRFYDNGKPMSFLHKIDKWCYVSDILPTKD